MGERRRLYAQLVPSAPASALGSGVPLVAHGLIRGGCATGGSIPRETRIRARQLQAARNPARAWVELVEPTQERPLRDHKPGGPPLVGCVDDLKNIG